MKEKKEELEQLKMEESSLEYDLNRFTKRLNAIHPRIEELEEELEEEENGFKISPIAELIKSLN